MVFAPVFHQEFSNLNMYLTAQNFSSGKVQIREALFKKKQENIARGTTDPEIDSETWTKLGNNMAPLALIGHQMAPLDFSH